VSPSRKREAAVKLQAEFAVSERRACRVIDQPRTSQRYQARLRDDEGALVKRMLELVRERPRFGYRRIAALLRKEFWRASATADLQVVAPGGTESASEEAKT
jgi:putative transposase